MYRQQPCVQIRLASVLTNAPQVRYRMGRCLLVVRVTVPEGLTWFHCCMWYLADCPRSCCLWHVSTLPYTENSEGAG